MSDFYMHSLEQQLKRARTALLWAIAEKHVKKAGAYAERAARLSRLLRQRQEKFGYVSKPNF